MTNNLILARARRRGYPFLVILFPLALFVLGFAVYLQNTYTKSQSNPYAANGGIISPLASPTPQGIQVGIGGGPPKAAHTPTHSTSSGSLTPSPTPKTYGPAY